MATRSGISFSLAAIIVVVILSVGIIAALEYNTTYSGTTKTATRSFTSSTITASSTPAITVTLESSSSLTSVMIPSVFDYEDWNVSGNTDGYPPTSISFNSNSDEIYLSDAPTNNITIVDANTHEVTGVFSMPGIYAGQVDVDPQSNILAVWVNICTEPKLNASACPPADNIPSVVVVNGSSGAVLHTFLLYPGDFAVDSATSRIYETRDCPDPNASIFNPYYTNCGFLTSYDMITGSLISNISLNAEAFQIEVNPNNNMLYVLNSSDLMLINATNFATEAETSLAYYSSSTPILQVDPTTDTVFALGINATSTIISAINGTTGSILYSTVIGSACTIDSNRYYVNSYTNQIYATGWNNTLGTNYFLVINASTGDIATMLSTQGYVYAGSTFNPDFNEIYLLATSGNASEVVSFLLQLSPAHVDTSLLSDSQCYDVPV